MVSNLPPLPTLNASLGIPVASLGFSKINLAFATALLCGVTASSLIATASYFGALPSGVETGLIGGSSQNETLVTAVESEPTALRPTSKPNVASDQTQRQLEEERRLNLLAQERAAAEAQRQISAERAQRELEAKKQQEASIENEASEIPEPAQEPDYKKDDIGLMIAGLNQDGDVDDLISTLEETGALPDLNQEPYVTPPKAPKQSTDPARPTVLADDSDEQAKSELDSLVASLGLTDADNGNNATANQAEQAAQPGLITPTATAPSLSDLTARLAASSSNISGQAGAGDAAWNARFGNGSGLGALNRIITRGGTPIPNTQVQKPAVAAPVNRQPTTDGRPRSFALSNTLQSPNAQELVQQQPRQQALSGPALQQAIVEYGKGVSERIRQAIRYPASLVPERIEGTVELGLIFMPDGSLSQVLILTSSKNTVIDENAVATVRNIRFPTPPLGATPEQLRFGIKMSYSPPKNQ